MTREDVADEEQTRLGDMFEAVESEGGERPSDTADQRDGTDSPERGGRDEADESDGEDSLDREGGDSGRETPLSSDDGVAGESAEFVCVSTGCSYELSAMSAPGYSLRDECPNCGSDLTQP
jgi:hypothetical protein